MASCKIPENDVNEVIPNLWLGNWKSSYDRNFIMNYNIKHIIRIMPDHKPTFRYNGVKYVHIPIRDDNTCYNDLTKMFETVGSYIATSLRRGEGVLVHCKRGHHRSAVVVCAFLIRYLGIDYVTACAYINSLRPCALRRDTCMVRALYRYYHHLVDRR